MVIIFQFIFVKGRSAHTDSGIADDTIQPPVMGDSSIHQSLDLRCITAIGLDKNGITTFCTDFIGNCLTLRSAAGGTHYFHSIFAVYFCDCLSNAAACACNNDNFSLNTTEIHALHNQLRDKVSRSSI